MDFGLRWLLICLTLSHLVSAANPPPSAYFQINFSQLNLPDGDWQLSIISIPAYGTDTTKANQNFNTIKSTYLDVKKICGVPDYIEVQLNPSNEEIKSYNGKEIVIQHYFEGDLYYILDGKEYSTCQIPIGYGFYNPNYTTILKNKYKATTNFWIYHYVKGYELTRGGEDIRVFYPPYCEIKNDTCNLYITQDTKGPYFVVLEKMNSKDEIYFSEPVNIKWEASGKVEWKEFKPGTYPLDINKLEFSKQNTLIVKFEDSDSIAPNPFPVVYYWIAGLVSILVFVVLFLVSKKKTN